ncbi:MAG: hypothetical protein IPF95_05215 [Flavobacteriales bacterium]|nr:hypothetical protein [Flavobacteriales bacterium]MBK6944174.1 hypothetical protein [Flavobacteriales bacterium]MBK7295331.1 hypothetical protein [Flavobacteriales bacterium]HQV51109.1 hypothetical protein [Flavobacteriales bacterium]HQZ44069.1 hypothetical protein [Flavobacteriales bacterium]
MKWFAVSMFMIYIVAGCLFLFTNFAGDTVRQYRTLFGAVLVGYGLIRGILWFRKNRRDDESKIDM